MKRILTLLLGLVFLVVASAQEASIGSYQDGNGSHKVVVRLKDDGRKIDCVFVYVASTLGKGYFRIDKNKLPEFITALKDVKTKFEEWSKQAKSNGVKKFSKQMDIGFPKVVIYLAERANFNFSQKPNVLFQVDNGTPQVWIYANTTTNFTRYNNKKEVFSILFDSSSEIDGLVSLLCNEETILSLSQEKLQDEQKINNLFQ